METIEKKVWVRFYNKVLSTPIKAQGFDIRNYIDYEHNQDCCEHVYIDYDHVDKAHKQVEWLGEITSVEFWTCPEDWFLVKLYNGELDKLTNEPVWDSIYLPCRNEQNWYYSDSLELIIKIEWEENRFDLQKLECVYNDIN